MTIVTDLAPVEQEDLYKKAAGLLQKMERKELDPIYYEEIVWDLVSRGQPTTNDRVKLKHVFEYFRNCAGRFNFVDNWARTWRQYVNIGQEVREDLRLDDMWLELTHQASDITMRDPKLGFRQIFLKAMRRVKPEEYLKPEQVKGWKQFNYYRKFDHSKSEESALDSIASSAFPFFHPHSALAELTQTNDRPTWRIPNRLWGMRFLREQIDRTKQIREQAIATARRERVSAEDLALLIGGYVDIQRPDQPAVQLQQQRTEKQPQPFAIDIQRMAYSLMAHMRRMYEDGIDGVIITDRGARPLGSIMKRINQEFGLPEIGIGYCKVSSRDKIIEAYAKADQALERMTTEERDSILKNAKLRATEKKYRQSGDKEQQRWAQEECALLLELRLSEVQSLYDRLTPVVDEMQQAHAAKAVGHLRGRKIKEVYLGGG